MLGVDGATNSKGRVELYERGYGKDAAGIAKEAISYGGSRFYPAVNFVLTVKQPATTTSTWYSLIRLDVCKTTRYGYSVERLAICLQLIVPNFSASYARSC